MGSSWAVGAGCGGAGPLPAGPLDGKVLIAGLERHQLEPMVEIADVAALPEVTLYPLPDQIADKVAAMVERHGPQGRASTRYRDLVDLVLIVRSCEVDAAPDPCRVERAGTPPGVDAADDVVRTVVQLDVGIPHRGG